ncbi:hypothetical protein K438DRAFT_1666173 [Mycena galopus ATCC 62051]|nr:hypothetical protein K438DRAFT_1666173 [Mycena galopus ATCC 62051]
MEVEAEPKRVEGLWFEDGNLIIQAGNTQYRVYRGVLAMHSPVFHDMFALPQPPDSELVNGCALVRLADSEEEVTSFLKAILHPGFFPSFPAQTEFHKIVGCLRLSHKYGVDYFRRRALVHLSSGYPTVLGIMNGMMYVGDLVGEMLEHPVMDMRSWNSDNWGDTIVAIQLAREVDAPWILPLAFYYLAAAYSEVGASVFHSVSYNGGTVSLSTQDQHAFARGHSKQITGGTLDVLRFLSDPLDVPGCEKPAQCIKTRLQAVDRSREHVSLNGALPLKLWDYEQWEECQWLSGLCQVCGSLLRRNHSSARSAFWNGLPELYGLPPWEELERLHDAAIGTKGTNVFC